MCKICVKCNNIMNYDPYFKAEVCGSCGKMERKESNELQTLMIQQTQTFSITKQIMDVMVLHSS